MLVQVFKIIGREAALIQPIIRNNLSLACFEANWYILIQFRPFFADPVAEISEIIYSAPEPSARGRLEAKPAKLGLVWGFEKFTSDL